MCIALCICVLSITAVCPPSSGRISDSDSSFILFAAQLIKSSPQRCRNFTVDLLIFQSIGGNFYLFLSFVYIHKKKYIELKWHILWFIEDIQLVVLWGLLSGLFSNFLTVKEVASHFLFLKWLPLNDSHRWGFHYLSYNFKSCTLQ